VTYTAPLALALHWRRQTVDLLPKRYDLPKAIADIAVGHIQKQRGLDSLAAIVLLLAEYAAS
jgi:hypothetical protein